MRACASECSSAVPTSGAVTRGTAGGVTPRNHDLACHVRCRETQDVAEQGPRLCLQEGTLFPAPRARGKVPDLGSCFRESACVRRARRRSAAGGGPSPPAPQDLGSAPETSVLGGWAWTRAVCPTPDPRCRSAAVPPREACSVPVCGPVHLQLDPILSVCGPGERVDGKTRSSSFSAEASRGLLTRTLTGRCCPRSHFPLTW